MKPLRFREILVPTIWGGEDIIKMKGCDASATAIGESWEISGVPGSETPVAEGEYEGLTLPQLIERFGATLVGKKNLEQYGTSFPLLIKFISAAQALSIQVHPDDAMANCMGHPYGKTEMWYLVDTAPGASLCSGFSHDFSSDAYMSSLADGTLTDHLAMHETHAGDCFFIPAGRIHSIGAGNFIVEIQQSSNDTFRVYDFDRTDANGNKRELHVEQAREALNYHAEAEYRTHYEHKIDEAVELVSCPQFTTHLIEAEKGFKIDHSAVDSFVIMIGYEGEALLTDAEGNEVKLSAGQSVLFPACNANVHVQPLGGKAFRALQTYVI